MLHSFTDTIPNLRYSLELSFNLINEIQDNKNFGLALEQLNTKKDDYLHPSPSAIAKKKIIDNTDEIKKSIELFRLLSFALKNNSTTDSSYYISADKISTLKNVMLLKNFLGLMVASTKLKGLEISFDETLYESLNNEEVKNEILKSTQLFTGLKEVTTLFKQANEKTKSEKINFYFSGISKLIESGKLFNNLIFKDKTDTIFLWIEKSNNLVKNLYAKNYTTSVLQILDFYTLLGEKTDLKLNQKLYKYGTFLAQISQLDDPKEVQELLEVYAAPVGSYRDKSIHKFSVSVDSFTGIGIGNLNWEKFKDSTSFSVSTPIGVPFSFSSGKGKFSYTIMPTLFDIGPLISYRFLNNQGEIPKIYLKEIIAPGIFGIIGFNSRFPLFLNIGWQKPSNLKTINATDKTYNLKPYNLFSANAAVNIPLFSLYNR